jgi:hypothetical protein
MFHIESTPGTINVYLGSGQVGAVLFNNRFIAAGLGQSGGSQPRSRGGVRRGRGPYRRPEFQRESAVGQFGHFQPASPVRSGRRAT